MTGEVPEATPPSQRSASATHARTVVDDALQNELLQVRAELRELNKVGVALMSERDPERLLGLILTQARALTTSDAGSLYLVEEGVDGQTCLKFLRSQNDTLPDLESPTFTLPIDEKSIAGSVASTAEPLVIDDVYRIEGRTYAFNKAAFDERFGYRAKSMLVVPMTDHRGKVVGVLQLINRKSDPNARVRSEKDADRFVLPYGNREVELVQSLAGQAAVSIENGRLYQAIENLFEGFIKAAVTAIDQRDPATSGHSVRVTELTCRTARLIDRQEEGPFADVRFSENDMKQLRYAGLLHDFGKVGVPEEVLVKSMKLSPVLEAQVDARFHLICRTLEIEAERARVEALRSGMDREAVDARLETIDGELEEGMTRLDRYREAVRTANVPRVLDEEAAGILEEIASTTFSGPDGKPHPYLSEEELHFLRIPRGNLDDAERKKIESHVTHSYDFLLEIPWTDDLSRIAEIVRGHHEKLNGKGYPDGVGADDLCMETRIMTVCDIFDALTASDRPYKKAMPVEKALQILRWEAEEGALDPDIVELFAESGVYRSVLETDWREL